MILSQYIFVGLLLLGAIGFALAPLVLVRIVAPVKRSSSKSDTYECGLLTTGETWVRFRIQYYIYALLFLVFDVETVFLYPWAVTYGTMGRMALIEMVIFLAMLAVGLAYAWAKGMLKWV